MTQITDLFDSPATSRGEGEQRKDLFGLLEQRVEALAERHREALARVEDLRRQLSERDREVAELARRVAQLQRLRDEVSGRVEQMIERIDRMSEWAERPPEGPAADGDGTARA
jgi:chromosome segregation ATPase